MNNTCKCGEPAEETLCQECKEYLEYDILLEQFEQYQEKLRNDFYYGRM